MNDVIGRYMDEVRAYPILDREEEHALALEYQRSKDPAIARRLIGSNLRLVVKLARDYQSSTQPLLDLVQEGNLGLVRSLVTYDPTRGIRLATYAAWWIRAYILKYVLDNARLVRFGQTAAQRKIFFNLSKERDRLEAEGITPDTESVARGLDVRERDVVLMVSRMAHPDLSLDAPLDRAEGGRALIDRMESTPMLRPDVLVEETEHRERLRRALASFAATLEGRNRVIFEERLQAEEPMTLQSLAARFGISRERARQLEQRVLDGLRRWMAASLDDATLHALPLAA